SLTEFADIFDAGLLELKIGTIPQNIDRVVIGDIERTRLSRVRVLFFLGINDGNIPVGSSRGGLISDLDREFLKQSAWELSPTPRQKMYIQRLYLYVIMTKPSELLYLSYARINSEGKSLRASYLIEAVLKLFPRLRIEKYDDKMTFAQMFSYADSLDAFILYLRRYVLKSNENNNACYENGITELDILAIIANVLKASEDYPKTLNNLINQAFLSYQHRPLSKKAADLLYGALLNNSVSRLEKFAGCAYAHFLKFGLALSERAKFSFEAVDLGNVYHGVLEIFAAKLAGLNLSLNNFSDEIGERLLREAVECYVAEYGSAVLFGSARDEQMIERIYRIMLRTVRTLNKQLKQGDFLPERYEVAFSQAEGLETVNMALSAEEKMTLRGRIDRIDTCEERNQVLVKVIDYKSGHKQFDLAGLYYGLQLQLVVYLNVALEMTEKAHEGKEVIPAAVLYYHVADPMITDDAELSREEIEAKLLSELKMTGIVNENEEVIKRIDRDFTDKSWVIPVSRKKDGSFTSNSGVLKQEDFAVLTDYVNQKITAMGKQIKSGDIDMAPYENKDGNACTYCDFKQVCGFDIRLPGYRTKKLDPLGRDEALELMRNNTQQNKES
ncbi:MAG: PD-(D/E)XK nuclease family protein, partial [Lachnospiraceae bacterium]|nr:PD-(D/E)XK nuclease family protein [Lachnospiraceae bacterium]